MNTFPVPFEGVIYPPEEIVVTWGGDEYLCAGVLLACILLPIVVIVYKRWSHVTPLTPEERIERSIEALREYELTPDALAGESAKRALVIIKEILSTVTGNAYGSYTEAELSEALHKLPAAKKMAGRFDEFSERSAALLYERESTLVEGARAGWAERAADLWKLAQEWRTRRDERKQS